MRLVSMNSKVTIQFGTLSRWLSGAAVALLVGVPAYAEDDAAANLQKARDAIKSAGLDPDKSIKIGSDGKVSIDGSYANSALKKAGININGTNVKSAIKSVSQGDVASKAMDILKSKGMDPSKYISVDSGGNVSLKGSYAASAMKAAEAGLRMSSIGSPVVSNPIYLPGGGGSPSTKPAAPPSGADAVRQAREILAAKGFDVNKSLQVKSDGTVAISGSYASSALREAGINLSGVNVKDSIKTSSASDEFAAASELLKSRGMDPSKYLSYEGGQVVSKGSYGASALEEAQQALRNASVDRPKPVTLPAGGTTTPGLPPVGTLPGTLPGMDPTLPPAIIPPIGVLPPSGEILPPGGLSLDIVDKEARALLEKGNSLNRSDKYGAAATVYQQAIDKARQSGDLEAVAASMVGLGMDQRKTDARDDSEKTYGDAIGLLQFMRSSEDGAKSKNGDRLLAIAEHGLAANDLVRGENADALDHYRKSAAYYREGGMNALVELSGDAQRIGEMEQKLKKAGKPIPKFDGLPDAKAYIASLYGGGTGTPPPAGTEPPPVVPPAVVPPVAGAYGEIYGFGVTRGGDEGKVITVTSLSDSGSGSFRDAVQKATAMGGNAIIKFAVEGDINLKSGVEIRAPNLTIDGYSAPGDGVTFRGGSGQFALSVVTHDVKIQNIAVRNGYDLIRIQPDTKGDMSQVHHIALDHVSLTNSVDGALDITRGANNITVQNCFIAGAGSAAGGGGSLVKYGTDNVTFYKNYWVGNERRNMLANDAFVDYRNNVVQNWLQWGTRWESGATGNAINNTYIQKTGGGLSDAGPKALYTYQGAGSVYFGGNNFQDTAKMGPGATSSKELNVPYSIPTMSAADAAKEVLQSAGKGSGNRDEVDLKYISLGTYAGAKSYKG
ncbi:MAG: hypothetical protein AAB215_02760 [Planctomycetota bacterium]